LFKLIQDGEKTLEEKKRQEDGVRAVVQYCQNEIDCRRVQVLGYFGQVFDRKDCRKQCNNCLDNAGSAETDMSEMAAQAIRLVKCLLSRDTNVTKLHCLDVFRGANLKAIRDRGHDRVPLFGAGSSLTREQCERLFDHLLSLEGFRQVPVPNKSGWNALYMQVCLQVLWVVLKSIGLSQLGKDAEAFLTGKKQLKMMIKVGGSSSVQPSKSKTTKATTRRTPGTVVSVNRSMAGDIFVDDDTQNDTVTELTRDTIDMDDIYDFGSSPPRPVATNHVQSANIRKADESSKSQRKKAARSSKDPDDVLQRCYQELLRLREEVSSKSASCLPADLIRSQIAREMNVNNSEDLVEESLLQIISAILPTGIVMF
jgi:superfamily II DNA helicase RecQ